MTRIKITTTPELNENIETLKMYYSEKTKSGAIKRAIKDCATVAEHKNIPCTCGENEACSNCK